VVVALVEILYDIFPVKFPEYFFAVSKLLLVSCVLENVLEDTFEFIKGLLQRIFGPSFF
jgi:hypothetical protein